MPEILELGFSRSHRKRFVDVEFSLNRKYSAWPPPLRADRMKYMDPRKNPFFEHAEVAHFVAVEGGRDVGRVAAIRNHRHEEIHEEAVGFFGFFEAIDDAAVARALLDRASEWLRSLGLTAIRGPMSYDTNAVSGALIDHFDETPTVLTAWNPPFVPGLIEACGFAKAKDLLAFDMKSERIPDRIGRLSNRLRKREGLIIRDFDKKRFKEEVDLVRSIYRNAWEKNWGFVPPTDAEFNYLAEDLKHVMDPSLVFFGNIEDRPVGFVLGLPDANQALLSVPSGRLFPFGMVKLLFAWKKINRLRVVILGVIPEYRNRGLELLFYRELFDRAQAGGYVAGEGSWVLEDNAAMVKGIEACNGVLVRTWRVFEKPLQPVS